MRSVAYVLVLLVAVRASAAEAPSETCSRAEPVLEAALNSQDVAERFRLADEVKRMCTRAAEAMPIDADATFRLVQALTLPDVDHPELCRPGNCEEALRRLESLRARDVHGVEAQRAWSEQGIVLSRMLRFADALAAYEHALPLVDPTRDPRTHDEREDMALLWGNSAETAMALGRLDEAVRRYELAIDASRYGSTQWQLALYGLGVALDRDGQGELARRTIAKALEKDPAIARLHDDSVFFEPPGDVAYYVGLAHEVAGDRAEARVAFEQFLKSQPGSPHAARARWHIARLGAAAVATRPQVEIGMPMLLKARRSPQSVRVRVLPHVGELLTCYTRALREDPALTVTLQLALEITPLGFVGQRAHVLLGSDESLSLTRCVELAAENWRFDPVPVAPDAASGEEGDVAMLPIDFKPGK